MLGNTLYLIGVKDKELLSRNNQIRRLEDACGPNPTWHTCSLKGDNIYAKYVAACPLNENEILILGGILDANNHYEATHYMSRLAQQVFHYDVREERVSLIYQSLWEGV